VEIAKISKYIQSAINRDMSGWRRREELTWKGMRELSGMIIVFCIIMGYELQKYMHWSNSVKIHLRFVQFQ
jgi:hypothetical protein